MCAFHRVYARVQRGQGWRRRGVAQEEATHLFFVVILAVPAGQLLAPEAAYTTHIPSTEHPPGVLAVVTRMAVGVVVMGACVVASGVVVVPDVAAGSGVLRRQSNR